MTDLSVLRAELHAYREFDECVVLGAQILDWGTTFVVTLDYVWGDDGKVRLPTGVRRIVSVRFRGVSDVHIINDLTDSALTDQDALGWSFGEIAHLTVDLAPALSRSRLSVPSFVAQFRREGYAWMTVAFVRWEFEESVGAASESPLNRP